MQTDNLNLYIFASIIIHALFLTTFNATYIQRDISQIGEQGMQIQMIMLSDDDIDIENEDSRDAAEKKVIKKQEKEAQAIVDNRLQGDRTNKIYQSYYGVIRSILDSNKKYPLLSLQRRQEGTPVVEFTILKNGEVINLKVTSSGYRLLDREAKKIVLKSAPFPSIPDSLEKKKIDLRVPINFNLKR